MIRTIVSFDQEDKRWLDQKAREQKTTLAALVREAVHQMREKEESPPFDSLLQQTKGLWQEGDGLAYQQSIRGEW